MKHPYPPTDIYDSVQWDRFYMDFVAAETAYDVEAVRELLTCLAEKTSPLGEPGVRSVLSRLRASSEKLFQKAKEDFERWERERFSLEANYGVLKMDSESVAIMKKQMISLREAGWRNMCSAMNSIDLIEKTRQS